VPSEFEFRNFPNSVLFIPTFKKGLTKHSYLSDSGGSGGRLLSSMSAIPSTHASTKETGDCFFSISFKTKPCDTDQTSGIIQVTKYCRARSWQFVVQHDSRLNNGWCLNVLIRPEQSGSIHMKSIASGLQAVLVKHAHISKKEFTVHKRACQLEESRVLDQSFCQDPCIETGRPQDVTPATPVASGSNAAIQNSGDE
jgi:transposase-like protein